MTTDDDNSTTITPQTPDFDSIKQTSPYGVEYWSARDLALLLGYDKWKRFDGAIKRGMTAYQQIGQIVEDHFPRGGKMVTLGSGAQREVKDYLLSRLLPPTEPSIKPLLEEKKRKKKKALPSQGQVAFPLEEAENDQTEGEA